MDKKRLSLIVAIVAYFIFAMLSFDVERTIPEWVGTCIAISLVFYVVSFGLLAWLERIDKELSNEMDSGGNIDYVLPETLPDEILDQDTKLDILGDTASDIGRTEFSTGISSYEGGNMPISQVAESDAATLTGESMDLTENIQTLSEAVRTKLNE